ncbi:hypothetical protein BC629DRAFT_1437292 [Irpex lacteus]|nr:hypothetical protein BC629DRAFT_1437292 [Irpex lacteus]
MEAGATCCDDRGLSAVDLATLDVWTADLVVDRLAIRARTLFRANEKVFRWLISNAHCSLAGLRFLRPRKCVMTVSRLTSDLGAVDKPYRAQERTLYSSHFLLKLITRITPSTKPSKFLGVTAYIHSFTDIVHDRYRSRSINNAITPRIIKRVLSSAGLITRGFTVTATQHRAIFSFLFSYVSYHPGPMGGRAPDVLHTPDLRLVWGRGRFFGWRRCEAHGVWYRARPHAGRVYTKGRYMRNTANSTNSFTLIIPTQKILRIPSIFKLFGICNIRPEMPKHKIDEGRNAAILSSASWRNVPLSSDCSIRGQRRSPADRLPYEKKLRSPFITMVSTSLARSLLNVGLCSKHVTHVDRTYVARSPELSETILLG